MSKPRNRDAAKQREGPPEIRPPVKPLIPACLRAGWAVALGIFVVFFAISAASYWRVLEDPNQVLAFNDGNIELALSPAFRFPDAMERVWENGMFFGNGLKQSPLSVRSLGEWFMGPVGYRRGGQALLLALCGLAFYWMLRQYRFGRPASALGGGFMILTGCCNNLALLGMAPRPIALGFAALALGFIERGRRSGSWLAYAAGGGCLGLGMAELPDFGLLLALSSAAVFWWTHLAGEPLRTPVVLKWVGKFVLYAVCCGLLAWQTINVMFSSQIEGVTQGSSESPESRFNWATQWSLPPEESWNIVSGTYFGNSIRSETAPYWGRMGRDANWEKTGKGFRNFCMTGWHMGAVPALLLFTLFALLLRRNPRTGDLPQSRAFAWMLFAGCLLSLMLQWGRYFPLYRLLWSLPYFGTFRNPEKWDGPFTLFAGIGAAFCADLFARTLAGGAANAERRAFVRRTALIAAAGLAAVAAFILLGTVAGKDGMMGKLVKAGYEQAYALLAWNNSVAACLKVLFYTGAVAGLVAWAFSAGAAAKRGTAAWLLAGLAVLGVVDLNRTNASVVQGHTYRQFLVDNPLTVFFDQHRADGRIKLLTPGDPRLGGLLNNLRFTQLLMKGYDIFDPISVSRMPTDYEALFKALEASPVRLWQLGSIRYFLSVPHAREELERMDGNRGRFVERLATGVGVVGDSYVPVEGAPPEQQILRIIEFTGAQPMAYLADRWSAVPPDAAGDAQALRLLADPGFDVAHQAIVHAGQVPPAAPKAGSPSSVTITQVSSTDTALSAQTEQPALLVRTTKFDRDWRVLVDGKPAELLRVNYLFQGVFLPAGTHQVAFSYRPSASPLKVAVTARVVLAFLLAGALFTSRRKDETP